MKCCSECGLTKPLDEFSKNRSSKDGYQSGCKKCRAVYLRSHYEKNKQYYKDKAIIGRNKFNEWYRKQKEKPCADCDNSYPYYVMDFDHTDSSNKENTVSKLATRGKRQEVTEEIAKCELVCSNCHRERTHQRKLVAVA